ncbi:homoserine O-acetyltransferase MetX [Jatrophihabitans sp. DSM 45814]
MAARNAYWRFGDDPGHRRFISTGALDLESGEKLSELTIAYETWGDFTGDNAVLVEHALTGDSHVTGSAGPGHPTAGWWDDLVGPGRGLDTNRWFVVATNVLGGCQGTTGPSSPAPDGAAYGSRFPYLTVRDQVSAEVAVADALGIDRWALVIGGSMGGMRALEWAVTHPERVSRLAVVASTAAASAEQIGLCSTQIHAIRADPAWRGGDYYDAGSEESATGDSFAGSPVGGRALGPIAGLGIARRIAHISYRSEFELAARFGREPQDDGRPWIGSGRYAVESYLDHHADKLAARFDAGSYVTLSESMNSHDVGRDRGGIAAALATVTASTLVVAVDSDRLYPTSQQAEIAARIPGASYREIASRYGHDGFLIETEQVGVHLAGFLAS